MNKEQLIPACEQEKVPKDFNWVIATVESQSGFTMNDIPRQVIKFQAINDDFTLTNHFRISFLSDKTLRENRSLIDNWSKRIYTSSEIQFLEDYK
jgi:hypothetical protein